MIITTVLAVTGLWASLVVGYFYIIAREALKESS